VVVAERVKSRPVKAPQALKRDGQKEQLIRSAEALRHLKAGFSIAPESKSLRIEKQIPPFGRNDKGKRASRGTIEVVASPR
jgi:hypothetical protein